MVIEDQILTTKMRKDKDKQEMLERLLAGVNQSIADSCNSASDEEYAQSVRNNGAGKVEERMNKKRQKF